MPGSPSIFNDVLGPVMRGPSSSHTGGSYRIGRLIRDLAEGEMERVLFEFHPGGSLATTYHTQGSDMGLAAGLIGIEITDHRMPESLDVARQLGLTLDFRITAYPADHPNTYKTTVYLTNGEQFTLTALSTGGGMIQIIEIEGQQVSLYGDEQVTVFAAGRERTMKPVLPVAKGSGQQLPFQTAGDLLALQDIESQLASGLAIRYESARSGMSVVQLNVYMSDLITIWRESIENGLQGTMYDDRLIGSQSPEMMKRWRQGKLIEAGPLNRMLAYSTAVMETKSSMGVIIAAPTAGAAGGLPGCLFGLADENQLDVALLQRGFWAAGLVGLFIAKEATFAAEVAGCQAETGAGGAMAAAGLVEMAGGNAKEAMNAASLALQNVMGLICDPIANRVEIPCLGRNAQAASNALASANMALGGIDPVIPLDETIRTMLDVGRAMPHTLRCTALGGLAITPTAKRLDQEINERSEL